jgi:predicted anti-sigma-YlaC factor YlaD
MKCKKIESLIYLYNELDEGEKHQVDTHMDGCSSCKDLLAQVIDQHSLIRRVVEIPILAASPERIKRNILQAIESNKPTWLDKINAMVSFYWLRTSLAVASILLVGFFFVEFSADYSLPTINATYNSTNIPLNTPKFLQAQVKRRESTHQISFYDCLKQSDCDFLKNLKPNKSL